MVGSDNREADLGDNVRRVQDTEELGPSRASELVCHVVHKGGIASQGPGKGEHALHPAEQLIHTCKDTSSSVLLKALYDWVILRRTMQCSKCVLLLDGSCGSCRLWLVWHAYSQELEGGRAGGLGHTRAGKGGRRAG